MNDFKPTWLYIKQHNKTGLKYFGKTQKIDPDSYNGSGLYWLRHLKEHGNDVTTIWKQQFFDVELLVEHALKFSLDNEISDSPEWANLKPENGLDGNPVGIVMSEESRRLMSIAASKPKSDKWKLSASSNRKGRTAPNLGKSHSLESRQKISEAVLGEKNPMYGRSHTEESRKRMSEARVGKSPSNKGIPLSEEQKLRQSEKMKGKTPWNKGVSMKQVLCKGCGKITTVAALGRYHKSC